jgi:hypothetical protein
MTAFCWTAWTGRRESADNTIVLPPTFRPVALEKYPIVGRVRRVNLRKCG